MCLRSYLTLLLFVIVSCISTFTNSEYRMVGGSDGNTQRTPYVALIRYMDSNHCVGSLVNLRQVVTAADCVIDLYKNHFKVAAGVTNLHDKWENGQVRKVEKVAYPPGYNFDTKHLNIAVMTLDSLIDKVPTVETIDLVMVGFEYDAPMRVRQFGWEYSENGEISNPIQFTDWTSLEPDDCKKKFRSPRIPLTPAMICASPATAGGCRVDRGTPGVVMGLLYAVASHYLNHADPNSLIVFTRVNNFEVAQFLIKELPC